MIDNALDDVALSREELKQINENLNKVVIERTDALLHQNNILVHHAFINAHKVRAPLARILGITNLIKLEVNTENNPAAAELLHRLNESANELDETLREVRISLDKAEFKK